MDKQLKSSGIKHVYKNQLLITGNAFGRKGGSGSLVYRVGTSVKEMMIGISTGSVGDKLFWASPIECLDEYEWKMWCNFV